ncbi:hypothetical protein WJX72_006170 [[Myrmecia] bisecta]|uniref:monogalactosyldiacylglycerol synthase n=1 Tax=[Myrmecia] bisecta TaxID=41462 RepID=A0AAW1R777_9CHLO
MHGCTGVTGFEAGAHKRSKASYGKKHNKPKSSWRVSSAWLGFGLGCGGFFGTPGVAHAVRLWPLRQRRKAVPATKKKRVMILMSDTGGGHRASAQALQAGFAELYGDEYQIDMVDLWTDHTMWPFNQMPRSYSFAVKNHLIWRCSYYSQQPRLVHRSTQRAVGCLVARQISAAYEECQPDLVVSVHPLMQLVPLRVLQQRIRAGLQKPINFATVVTDLTTCHNSWFHPGVTKCFVATEFAKRRALRMGLKPDQVVVHGLPIRPAFSRQHPHKQALRRALHMDPGKPAVLLVGGGEGMGPVEQTVDALVEQGFVDNLDDWMSAVDCIITKAGPGTIAESLVCGLPILLNGFIPCQEYGNVSFVLDNKVGAFERDPVNIANTVKSWFGERRDELEAMAERARCLAQPQALQKIVRDLAALA